MPFMILLCSIVILLAIVLTRFSNFLGMPALLFFLGLGLLFGDEAILTTSGANSVLIKEFCSVALAFIIFYGGFCTKWKQARPIALKSVLLSTLGVVITTMLTCIFCHRVLGFHYLESLLIGAVISSTDAASVFSILRSKKLNLKEHTASLLEFESGSNDPFAYILIVLALTLLQGQNSYTFLVPLVFMQVVVALAIGVSAAYIAAFILRKTKFVSESNATLFVIAIFMVTFAIPEMYQSNAYLAVYVLGLILGNIKFGGRTAMLHFFDGLSALSQIFAFFLLGLLAFPDKMSGFFVPALLIALFLTFIARPIAVFMILAPLKSSFRQCLLVSWAGLRGAASIVFAIIALGSGITLSYDLFHIVFLVCLLSVALQGSLLPLVSHKLNMIDDYSATAKTFNDYQEDATMKLIRIHISKNHEWVDKMIKDVKFPEDSLALMIIRDNQNVIPKGSTKICANDIIILSIPLIEIDYDLTMKEITIRKHHKWVNKRIAELELPKNNLILTIKRGSKNIVPRGNSKILENDIVVIYG